MLNKQAVGRALTIAISVTAHQAQAEYFSLETGATREAGPKTLLEVMIGESKANDAKDKSADDDRLDPDRPHFPEASTTVGKDRAVLESGYTFAKKENNSFLSHAYPESLLRVGMFEDWFEFRIGQNFLHEQEGAFGRATIRSGAQDLYLGAKLALTEQWEYLPAIVVIPQTTVPTGSSTLTSGKVLPGVNVDCGWEVIKNFFSLELLVANNLVADDTKRSRFDFATGLTAAFQLTKKLEGFVEWDAVYQIGGGDPGPRHYAVAGVVYFLTPNFAVDARTGVGLNERSNDLLAGIGFAVRF